MKKSTLPYLLLAGIGLLLSLRMFIFPLAVERELIRLDWLFALRVRVWFILCRWLLGVDMVIVDGYRTPAEQNKLHQQNPKNPAYSPTGRNSHVEGVGVDVNGYKKGVLVLRKTSPPADWKAAVLLAQLCGLRWGGTFKGYYDANHFDGY